MAMTTEGKALLGKTIRALRERLLGELGPSAAREHGDGRATAVAPATARAAAVEAAAFAWVVRAVVLRRLAAAGLRREHDELATELPGLFGSAGVAERVPLPASTRRAMEDALDDPRLASCWTDDMTLGWVHQYWNDPQREALDAKLNAGGKVERHEIASKTQLFTERYMVDWLLHNSLGPMWLAMCKKHGWTAEVEADGTLARLEARRAAWRRKREAGEVSPTEPMPLETEAERRWAYYVPQPLPDDAVAKAPRSVRDLKVLDPAVGSGHVLVAAVDLLVAMYREEARHRGETGQPQWSDRAIVERVLEESLHGIDLDPRAVEVAAVALWLKAKQIAKDATPARVSLVASSLGLAELAHDDPRRVALREEVARETGMAGPLVDALVHALRGADHLGSLLKLDDAVDDARRQHEAGRGGAVDEVRLRAALERFLARCTRRDDLGLRLRDQPPAGVRLLRMVQEGTVDLVVGNPPYQGTRKLSDAAYVQAHYPRGKADLYAAFLQRGLELVREGGVSALLTMRGWMFTKQYAGLRQWLLESFDLRALGDFDRGAFEAVPDERVSVVASVFRRGPPQPEPGVALRPTPRDDRSRDAERTTRKRAATLCHVGRGELRPAELRVVPDWPLVYWWSAAALARYASHPRLGQALPVRQGLATSDNARFLRRHSELRPGARDRWPSFVRGGSGRAWIEPVVDCIDWRAHGLAVKVYAEAKYGSHTRTIKNEAFYGRRGVSFTAIGVRFSGSAHRVAGIFGHTGSSVFDGDVAHVTCLLNSSAAQEILASLNPGMHFEVGDVSRLPLLPIAGADAIFATLESAFGEHESHREASVEFRAPGPSPWRHAQAWAQQAVDRPDGAPLPPYHPARDPEPPTDHLSHALGVALGRFAPDGSGLLDPSTTALAHALPCGTLFLDGTLDPDDPRDSLGHPAAAPLHAAWSTHGAAIAPKRSLRDYLRLELFAGVHRPMYENRPIHFPLSSERRTFVAWVNVHRWSATTLRTLLADHLRPALTRLDGRLADLRAARGSGDAEAARAADKRVGPLQRSRDELDRFIADVTQCAERGPLPPDAQTPPREADAPYDPDLDDGVMINAAALWPLLQPQWKDPATWWKELATASGRKDYDWSRLAARYFPTRVDAKCRQDPSLAVAHRCLWEHHPARAYAWELRLRDALSPDFTLDEPSAAEHRERFLAEHPEAAAELRAKAAKRRERKASPGEEPDDPR